MQKKDFLKVKLVCTVCSLKTSACCVTNFAMRLSSISIFAGYMNVLDILTESTPIHCLGLK